jgi:hypothetical protein
MIDQPNRAVRIDTLEGSNVGAAMKPDVDMDSEAVAAAFSSSDIIEMPFSFTALIVDCKVCA